jgi:hypothetical protein
MERKEFLRGLGLLGLGSLVIPIIKACNSDDANSSTGTTILVLHQEIVP